METGWKARRGIKSDASSFFTPPPFLKLQFLIGLNNNVADASHGALTSSHVVCMIAIMQYDFVYKSVVLSTRKHKALGWYKVGNNWGLHRKTLQQGWN